MSCAVEHLKGSAFYTLMQLSPFLRCFPYCRSPLKGNPRQPRSGGQLDAIDFVTISIPSLRSLRSRHNLHHFSYYATSPAWQLRNKTPRILVLFVKSDTRFARRLAARVPASKLHIIASFAQVLQTMANNIFSPVAHFACLGRHTHGIRLGQAKTFKSKHGVGNVFARDCVLVVI